MRYDVRLLEVSPDSFTDKEIERLQKLASNLIERMVEIEEVSIIKGNVCWSGSGEEVANT